MGRKEQREAKKKLGNPAVAGEFHMLKDHDPENSSQGKMGKRNRNRKPEKPLST